ncbi:hypothetical protein JTE90_025116 [Oedothorax gibbosus]|uniref:Uncharacterized protein n=1 Tax=Oedothorax gibbosus TaxID=931172 RepID=A0AAV6U339_9ARAC|nr:hypothetical protein JTE90_025116 [Oedothorax gibbosus]
MYIDIEHCRDIMLTKCLILSLVVMALTTTVCHSYSVSISCRNNDCVRNEEPDGSGGSVSVNSDGQSFSSSQSGYPVDFTSFFKNFGNWSPYKK